MELDEMKSAWQALDRRLERQYALDFDRYKSGKLNKLNSSLRPLFVGQLLQILFGVCFVVLAGLLWSCQPDALPVILAGIVVHAYGIATIVLAGITLGQIRRIDHSAAILDIQKQLAHLRTTYIYSGMIAGLPWWFLWVPILMVLSGLSGVNLYAHAPGMVWIGLGIGTAGLAGTWWFHRWSRQPGRPRLAKAMEDSVTGGSLRKARQALDEIEQFERD
ncbi:MAG: serine/threonine protein kinase [Proteobacteria bacterium]|nr:serine/threonine protein kinase [Pseudomonadota bacterium]